MLEAIERLRESFSDARSARREHLYGLYLQDVKTWRGFKKRRSTLRICTQVIWRDSMSGKWGEIARIERDQELEVTALLLAELERLRSLRRLKVAA